MASQPGRPPYASSNNSASHSSQAQQGRPIASTSSLPNLPAKPQAPIEWRYGSNKSTSYNSDAHSDKRPRLDDGGRNSGASQGFNNSGNKMSTPTQQSSLSSNSSNPYEHLINNEKRAPSTFVPFALKASASSSPSLSFQPRKVHKPTSPEQRRSSAVPTPKPPQPTSTASSSSAIVAQPAPPPPRSSPPPPPPPTLPPPPPPPQQLPPKPAPVELGPWRKDAQAKDYKVLHSSQPEKAGELKGGTKRVNGQGLDQPTDPRKRRDSQPRARTHLDRVSYKWTKESVGAPPPPPPSAILVTGFPTTTTYQQLRQEFGRYGRVDKAEQQFDKMTGGNLCMIWIKYFDTVPRSGHSAPPSSVHAVQDGHEAAKDAVRKGNGSKIGSAMMSSGGAGVKVVLDGNQKLCRAAVEAEMRIRHPPRQQQQQQQRPSQVSSNQPNKPPMHPLHQLGRPPPPPPSTAPPPPPSHAPPPFGQRPYQNDAPHHRPDAWRPDTNGWDDPPARHQPTPPLLMGTPNGGPPQQPHRNGVYQHSPPQPVQPPPRFPAETAAQAPLIPSLPAKPPPAPLPPPAVTGISSMIAEAAARAAQLAAQPSIVKRDGEDWDDVKMKSADESSSSESEEDVRDKIVAPNPNRARPGVGPSIIPVPIADELAQMLSTNGNTFIAVYRKTFNIGRSQDRKLTGGEIHGFFSAYAGSLGKLYENQQGWYISFTSPYTAKRAFDMLQKRQLAGATVELSLCEPIQKGGALPAAAVGKQIEQTSPQAARTAKAVEQKRVWAPEEMLSRAQEMIGRQLLDSFKLDLESQVIVPKLWEVLNDWESKQLQSLRTAKPAGSLAGLSFKKRTDGAAKPKPKPAAAPARREYSDSSEDEAPVASPPKRVIKREAIKKEKTKKKVIATYTSSDEDGDEEEPTKSTVVSIKAEVEPPSKEDVEMEDVEASASEDLEAPQAALISPKKAKPTKVRSPVKPREPTPPPEPTDDPFTHHLAADEEDLFYLKLALDRARQGKSVHPTPPPSDEEEDEALARHPTGCARTEGFYTITIAEKLANRPLANRAKASLEEAKGATMAGKAVSRMNRAKDRTHNRDMEIHKKVTATDSDVLKFNQLRTRKKQLTFSRSGIEGYGLFAMEHIPAGEMVIEYVGELIRQQVADLREKAYERQGIGSSYLFRVDEDLVVDATKKGNLGRLINHCCAPNCTAKIIQINGEKKIVIYAKTAIEPGDEVTYDYHFPIEPDNKIVCLCASPLCRKYLN